MTRNEAIEELIKMLNYYSIRQDSNDKQRQALELAIASLNTDDYLDIFEQALGEVEDGN